MLGRPVLETTSEQLRNPETSALVDVQLDKFDYVVKETRRFFLLRRERHLRMEQTCRVKASDEDE